MNHILYRLLLLFPLGVYFLPHFKTGFEHDVLLLGVCFYLFLRGVNSRRMVFPREGMAILTFILLALAYGIGWMGLVRGYVDTAGRWVALFPLLLLPALLFRPPAIQDSAWHGMIRTTALSLIWAAALLLGVNILLSPSTALLDFEGIGPFSVLLVIVLLSTFHTSHPAPLNRPLMIWLLFGISLAVAAPSWTKNFQAWWTWMMAGEAERAWAPYQYEDLAERAQNERMPYRAAIRYYRVDQLIHEKGFLPLYHNWSFFLRYRMAIQGIHAWDSALTLRALPYARVETPAQEAMLRSIWNPAYMNGLRYQTPDLSPNERLWVDVELHPQSKIPLWLDRWGRIFFIENGELKLRWEPSEPIYDAADLECLGDTFILLRKNGGILTSQPMTLFERYPRIEPILGKTIDLEIFPDGQTALVVTSRGEMCRIGAPLPYGFPLLGKFLFRSDVIVDMEIDRDQLGYYLLDIFGAIHSDHEEGKPSMPHSSPAVPTELLPYWANQRMAIDLELDPAGRALLICNRLGEVFCVTPQPYRETYRPPEPLSHRGLCLKALEDKTLLLFETSGNMMILPKDMW